MENLSSETKLKIQKLLLENGLSEALNLINPQNESINIILLKANINRLQRDKAGMDKALYETQINSLKQRISSLVGIKYQSETKVQHTKLLPKEHEANSKKIAELEAVFAAKIQQQTSPKMLILQGNLVKLTQQRRLGTILESQLQIQLNRIIRELNQ